MLSLHNKKAWDVTLKLYPGTMQDLKGQFRCPHRMRSTWGWICGDKPTSNVNILSIGLAKSGHVGSNLWVWQVGPSRTTQGGGGIRESLDDKEDAWSISEAFSQFHLPHGLQLSQATAAPRARETRWIVDFLGSFPSTEPLHFKLNMLATLWMSDNCRLRMTKIVDVRCPWTSPFKLFPKE